MPKIEEKKIKVGVLEYIFFWLFSAFIAIVKSIFAILIAIIDLPRKVIATSMIYPFKKELRQCLKIQHLLKKLSIYDAYTNFRLQRLLGKSLEKLLDDDNYRFFYVKNDKCKREGLYRLIDIVKKDFEDEIYRRATIDYDKEIGVNQSSFKQGIAFIFFALAFVACLPFVVVSYALTVAEKALIFLPEKLIGETSVSGRRLFKKSRARFEQLKDSFMLRFSSDFLIWSPHREFMKQLEMIDDLAEIKKKLWLGERPSDQTIGESKKKLENALVEKYLTQLKSFEQPDKDVSRRLKDFAIDKGNAPCKFACCTSRNGI